MRVSFSENLSRFDGSGKHKFLCRLSKALSESGHVIVNSKESSDIHLMLPGSKLSKKAKVNVLRLDGLIINEKEQYQEKNEKILTLAKSADAIVFQNDFCKEAYNKFLGFYPKKYACILNGAPKSEFLFRAKSDYFLANAKWRPHKRLNTIIEAFLLALECGINSRLVVTGEVEKPVLHPKIEYTGLVNNKRLVQLLSGCISSLHLSWIDWAPNSLVEAILSGVEPIYSLSGGHSYVAKNNGIGISDTQWDCLAAVDYYSPPNLDLQEIVNAMFVMQDNFITINGSHLYIEKIASEYIDFFQKVLA